MYGIKTVTKSDHTKETSHVFGITNNFMEAKVAASIAIHNIMNELGGRDTWKVVEESDKKYHARAARYGFEFVVEVIEVGA